MNLQRTPEAYKIDESVDPAFLARQTPRFLPEAYIANVSTKPAIERTP
jgi:hypothetical protein